MLYHCSANKWLPVRSACSGARAEAFPFLAALVEHMARGCFHTWIKAMPVTRAGAVDDWKLMRAFKGVSGVKGTECLSWGSRAREMGSNALACTLGGGGGRGLNRMLCLSAKYNLSMLSFPVWSQFEREPVGQVSKQWE